MSRSVLVIDDDETDVMFLREAFRQLNDDIEVRHAVSGDEGLARMREAVPDLVLLDLKMPGSNGLEVLSAIRIDSSLRRSKVIVFSSSDNRVDVREAYENAANAYIAKPSTMSGYQHVAESLSALWLGKVLNAN